VSEPNRIQPLTPQQVECLVVAVLAVNRFPLIQVQAIVPRLRAGGLMEPCRVASMKLPEVIAALESSGYDRGGLTWLLATRVKSLMDALQAGTLDVLGSQIQLDNWGQASLTLRQVHGIANPLGRASHHEASPALAGGAFVFWYSPGLLCPRESGVEPLAAAQLVRAALLARELLDVRGFLERLPLVAAPRRVARTRPAPRPTPRRSGGHEGLAPRLHPFRPSTLTTRERLLGQFPGRSSFGWQGVRITRFLGDR
jgi:hypothetical protein